MSDCKLDICLSEQDCAASIGGSSNIWLLNKDDVAPGDITFDTSGGDYDGAVTAWTSAVTPLLYKIPFLRESAQGQFSWQNPQTANAQYYLHAILFAIRMLNQRDMNWFDKFRGSRLMAILETKNAATDDTGVATGENIHLLFGFQNGLEILDNEVSTGAARDDLSGGTLTINGGDVRPPREIRPASGTIKDIIDGLGVCEAAY